MPNLNDFLEIFPKRSFCSRNELMQNLVKIVPWKIVQDNPEIYWSGYLNFFQNPKYYMGNCKRQS